MDKASKIVLILLPKPKNYSPVPNKRPGRLIFSNIFAFGTVIETGTLIFFPTFLESSTIIMVLSALVRLLGFEDCACETGRPRGLRAVRPKRQKRNSGGL